MKDFVLVTDSTADLPYEVYKRLEIEVVPMEFIMGEKNYYHYADAREMSFKTFYKNIRAGQLASTSQINYFTYESVFRPILEAGKDILYIAFTSGLSGTYHSGTLVVQDMRKSYPERKIEIIDSLSASVGEGVLVYRAGLLRMQGMSLEELAVWTEENKLRACHWFVVDDLLHLKAGGRISAVQATLGTALNLKPMLSVDDDGKLVTVTKIRGSKKVVDAFVSRLKSDTNEKQTVVIGHADNMDLAMQIKERLKELDLIEDAIISDVGPIIGTHVGAGMTALAFMGERNYK